MESELPLCVPHVLSFPIVGCGLGVEEGALVIAPPLCLFFVRVLPLRLPIRLVLRLSPHCPAQQLFMMFPLERDVPRLVVVWVNK